MDMIEKLFEKKAEAIFHNSTELWAEYAGLLENIILGFHDQRFRSYVVKEEFFRIINSNMSKKEIMKELEDLNEKHKDVWLKNS